MSYTGSGISIHFNGAAGNQFGRNTFVAMFPFNVVERFLVVFPEVQRKIDPKRVKSIAQYILSGLNQNNYCFLSSVTATSRGKVDYIDEAKVVDLDINSVLSINDGQHRIEGIKLALKHVRKELEDAKEDSDIAIARDKVERLENMCVPVVIFDQMDRQHEQQLFHDLNLLAAKPNKSISLKFDNTDLYNRMAKELSVENSYVAKYGVETEKAQIKGANSALMVLSTLRNTISYIVAGADTEKGDHVLTVENYDEWKSTVNEALESIFEALPSDCNDRDKYIIGLAATIQGIGKYVHHLLSSDEVVDWKAFLAGLRNINWKHDNKMWNGYGGSYDDAKKKFIFSGTGSGVNGVCAALIENNRPFRKAV